VIIVLMRVTNDMSEMVVITKSAMVISNTTTTTTIRKAILIAMMKQFHSVFQFVLVVIMKAIVAIATTIIHLNSRLMDSVMIIMCFSHRKVI